jgi:hypothetical protein
MKVTQQMPIMQCSYFLYILYDVLHTQKSRMCIEIEGNLYVLKVYKIVIFLHEQYAHKGGAFLP